MNPNVGDLRPDVFQAMEKLRKDFKIRTGKDTKIPYDGGVRTPQDQTRIYADSVRQGFRAATPGNSPHEYGAAFDLNIVGATAGDAQKDHDNPLYKTLADLAQAYGLKAGFYFKSGKPDPYHFEADEPLAVQRDKWRAVHQERSGASGPSGATTISAVGVVAILGLLWLAVRKWMG